MSWEDQGRQGHGWFGNGSSGVVATSEPRRDETVVAKEAVRVAVAHLPRRVRAEFEDFTGQDGGARMLEAMAVWTDAAGMDAASFRRVAVGPGVSKEGAAALQAMGRALADASDPAAGQVAGEHLAAALNSLQPSSFSYDLCYAQDQAVYAAANGQVPDRAAPVFPPVSGPAQPSLPTIVVRPGGEKPDATKTHDVPAIVAALTTMALRLGPVAFAEAAPVLLAFLPEIVLAAVVIAVIIKLLEKPDQEALVPPAVPPQAPGLVPQAVPGGGAGEGGFTAVPSPGQGGDAGTTPAPALPHVEEGPGVAPQMPLVSPMARPKITEEDEKRRQAIIRSKGLPTKGQFPCIPPRDWNPRGDPSIPLPKAGKKGGYLDARERAWVWPRGDKMVGGRPNHWDVQLPGGGHKNITTKGEEHH